MLTQEQQIFEQIKKAKNILITFPKSWNGDAIGSALALFFFLKKLDKKVKIVSDIPQDPNIAYESSEKLFSFLPGFKEIKSSLENLRNFIISLDISRTKVKQIKYRVEDNILNFIVSPEKGFFRKDDVSSRSGDYKYDLIITLDTPDLESLGRIYDADTEFFYNTPIINIDHHSDNEEFGQINHTEITAVSTSEILFSLFSNYSRDIIDEDTATCLLTGIIYKTKSFRTANVTPNTLMITSQLISMGASREKIVNKLYRSRSLNVLKLWGRVLARLSSSMDNKLVWSTLSYIDFVKTDSKEKDLGDVIDELIVNIPQAKIVVIIYEFMAEFDKKDNQKYFNQEKKEIRHITPTTKLIIYSTSNINSLDLIKEYKPQGTKKLAQANINKGLQSTEDEIIQLLKDKLNKLPI